MNSAKLVIRRLPPTMSEGEFIQQVSPLPEYDYFCYFAPETSLGQYAFSRAYINFLNHDDLVTFRDKFDNYVFLDKNGHEYLAVVENSMWHKAPKSGPFYHAPSRPPMPGPHRGPKETQPDPLLGTIEQDKDYLNFIDKLDKQKKRVNTSVPSSTLEANLDELTNSSSMGHRGHQKVMTPLLEFVKQKFEQASSSQTNATTTGSTNKQNMGTPTITLSASNQNDNQSNSTNSNNNKNQKGRTAQNSKINNSKNRNYRKIKERGKHRLT